LTARSTQLTTIHLPLSSQLSGSLVCVIQLSGHHTGSQNSHTCSPCAAISFKCLVLSYEGHALHKRRSALAVEDWAIHLRFCCHLIRHGDFHSDQSTRVDTASVSTDITSLSVMSIDMSVPTAVTLCSERHSTLCCSLSTHPFC
jgi:hypothetical protein